MHVGEIPYSLSVCGDPAEASYDFISEDAVPFMGNITHSVIKLEGEEELRNQIVASKTGLELFFPLLLLLILVLMAEGFVGTPRRYKTKQMQEQGSKA